MEVKNYNDLLPDHVPVLLTLSSTVIRRQKCPVLTTKKTDQDKFRNELDWRITIKVKLKSTSDLDKQAKVIVENIEEATKAATFASIIAETEENCYPLEVRNLIKK